MRVRKQVATETETASVSESLASFFPSFPSHFELIHLNWHNYCNDTLRPGEPAVPLAAHRLPWSSGASLPASLLASPVTPHQSGWSPWVQEGPVLKQGEASTPGRGIGQVLGPQDPVRRCSWAPAGTGPGLPQVTETPSTNGLSLHQGFNEQDRPEESRVQYRHLGELVPSIHGVNARGPGSQSL